MSVTTALYMCEVLDVLTDTYESYLWALDNGQTQYPDDWAEFTEAMDRAGIDIPRFKSAVMRIWAHFAHPVPERSIEISPEMPKYIAELGLKNQLFAKRTSSRVDCMRYRLETLDASVVEPVAAEADVVYLVPYGEYMRFDSVSGLWHCINEPQRGQCVRLEDVNQNKPQTREFLITLGLQTEHRHSFVDDLADGALNANSLDADPNNLVWMLFKYLKNGYDTQAAIEHIQHSVSLYEYLSGPFSKIAGRFYELMAVCDVATCGYLWDMLYTDDPDIPDEYVFVDWVRLSNARSDPEFHVWLNSVMFTSDEEPEETPAVTPNPRPFWRIFG